MKTFPLPGPRGAPGRSVKGDKGLKGDQGDNGAAGPRGEKGDRGPPGDRGKNGAKGLQGLKGDKGERGIAGISLDQGVDITPVMAELETIRNEISNIDVDHPIYSGLRVIRDPETNLIDRLEFELRE